ncbi:riboflavin kinase [Lecanosticta acicola]|uniref:Riboflavin kinase n=1 Tax=Lecanosticta acicola TaxID=111012 RepID=A0AAI8Z245_9PEZI|nr:riboflavin kinase [Lecanosticta acicola]
MGRDRPHDEVAGPDDGPQPPFPLRLNGKVIKGFGRGSADLGIPTANIPLSGLSVGGHEDVESGVYYGWAGLSPSTATGQHPPGTESKYKHMASKVLEGLNAVLIGGGGDGSEERRSSFTKDSGAVYPMVMSIGWNPYYKNTVRSVEVHIMHHFGTDFYDSHMNLLILGFIRPELDYTTKEALIEDIKTDITVAGRSLSRKAYAKYSKDPYLLDFEDKTETAS